MPTLAHQPLDAREERAWRSYHEMERELAGRIRRQLNRDTGLSDADYEVLRVLADAPDGILRARELRCEVRWEKSRLSHQIGRMEGRGLVTREDCDEDSRGSVIRITAAGRDVIVTACCEHAKAVRAYLIDRLSPEQLEALADISETVLAGLEADTS
ncbi:MAG TPA: MarR family winged helix-turn-helix transcriptional regulator [Nocardioidaceae bacterium]|nr:MarR family winged helix-turn-helix transcriptional regulator [Nocardioidaceae bacterium]